MCFYHVRGSILRIFFYFFVFPVALRPTCVMSHVGSRNPPPLRSPLRSPLTILPLQMLFQNNQGDSSNEDAEPEAKDAKSPLQCTLTAQILVHGAERLSVTLVLNGQSRCCICSALSASLPARLNPQTHCLQSSFPMPSQTPL